MDECATIRNISESWMVKNSTFRVPDDSSATERFTCLWKRLETAIHALIPSFPPKSTPLLKGWFDRLIKYHSESARFYHTICHLEEMFGFTDILTTLPYYYDDDSINKKEEALYLNEVDKASIALAVFFHDAIYNVRSSTNEEDSAILFETFLSELQSLQENETECDCCWEDVTKRISRFILATKSHSPTDAISLSFQTKEDEKRYKCCLAIFLDADMAVLGKESMAYEHYAAAIRNEYEYVPRETYCSKRADILESFLVSHEGDTPKNVFSTIYMQEALEEQARNNLKQEIQSLRQGIIPQENIITIQKPANI